MASATTRTQQDLGSEAITEGVRISVEPSYMPDHSNPAEPQYLFAYRVRIVNEGEAPVTLISRAWRIVDAEGEPSEVRGPGVIGEQPTIAPGETYEYASYCPLKTPWGTMEGSYRMRRPSGDSFDAAISRFYLVAPGET